jgi:hypothetical protein
MSEKYDFFNAPPPGFVRTGGGWMQIAQTPQKRQLDKLRIENRELMDRLSQIESVLADLYANTNKPAENY